MEEVTIQHITYQVVDKASARAAQFPRLMETIQGAGWDDQLYIKRPNGTKGYVVNVRQTKYGPQYSEIGRGF